MEDEDNSECQSQEDASSLAAAPVATSNILGDLTTEYKSGTGVDTWSKFVATVDSADVKGVLQELDQKGEKENALKNIVRESSTSSDVDSALKTDLGKGIVQGLVTEGIPDGDSFGQDKSAKTYTFGDLKKRTGS